MSFFKNFIPDEFDAEKRKEHCVQKKKATAVKAEAKQSLSRFAKALLELEYILKEGKNEPDK